MFTFVNLYMCAYVITMMWFFYFIFTFKLLTFISQNNFVTFWTVITKYFKYNFVLIILFLQLSGLPPFFFFVIKLNFLLLSMYKVIFIIQFLIFLNIMLNCFFYLKIFMVKNFHISNDKLKEFSENYDIIDDNCAHYNKKKYKYLYWFNFFLAINALSFVWFADVYYSVFTWFIFLKK